MNVYYLNLAQSHTGLCNQLFSLFSTIIYCIKNKIKYILVDKFLREINTSNYVNISTIFNLKKLNTLLKSYNVIVVDSLLQNFKIKKVVYGTVDSNIEITDTFNSLFLETVSIKISKNNNLNELFNGDPTPFNRKQLVVYLEPEYNITLSEKNGYILKDININLNNLIECNNFELTPNWDLLKTNKDLSDFLFKNMCFADSFINIKNDFFSKLISYNKINVIHLRLENDIEFWSKINNMRFDYFYDKLSNIYIELIKTYVVDKNDLTVILSYNTNNKVTKYLQENNYNYTFVEKNKSNNREENAIVDLLIGTECNNTFIGAGSSTFTDTLSKVIKNNMSIFININNILEDPMVVHL